MTIMHLPLNSHTVMNKLSSFPVRELRVLVQQETVSKRALQSISRCHVWVTVLQPLQTKLVVKTPGYLTETQYSQNC